VTDVAEPRPPYGRVLLIWAAVLAALFAFQQYFS